MRYVGQDGGVDGFDTVYELDDVGGADEVLSVALEKKLDMGIDMVQDFYLQAKYGEVVWRRAWMGATTKTDGEQMGCVVSGRRQCQQM